MKLKDIMSTEVEIVPPDASIQQAAAKMRSLDVGALPVCDGRRLVGMIADRDITIRATAEGRDPKTTVVRDCLSSEPVYGFEGQDLEDAQTLMGTEANPSAAGYERWQGTGRDRRFSGSGDKGERNTSRPGDPGDFLLQIAKPAPDRAEA